MKYKCDFLEPGCYCWTIWDRSDIDGPTACRIGLVFRVLEFEGRKFVGSGSYYEGAGDFLVLRGCTLEMDFADGGKFRVLRISGSCIEEVNVP